MPVMTAPEIEVDDLTHLDWDPSVPCSYEGCGQDAAWWLICGICSVGKETVCELHRNVFMQWIEANPFATITFNGTCGHTPMMSLCWWEPFKI